MTAPLARPRALADHRRRAEHPGPPGPARHSFVGHGQIWIRSGQTPYGRRSPSLLGRRVTDMRQSFAATRSLRALGPHQTAGITTYYNSRNWYYLAATADGLVLTVSDRGRRTIRPPKAYVPDEIGLEKVGGQILAFGFTGAFFGRWVRDPASEGATAGFRVQP